MSFETISHYRIISKLGAGGMGEVYLAEDTKLVRQVAIKVLRSESVGDQQANKRLIREAQSAAKLDHPNICAIHEVGEADGRSFIVMQYVEGETLANRIQRAALELKASLDTATQIADALAEAHARGIIHRDIKPQNIMITSRGQAKVMDFGLAKLVRDRSIAESEAPTESLLTEPGALVGTVPYMSPEQVRGETVDARSDIFSLGAVLYEMVSGRRPFAAESAAATFSAILTREPPPIARYSIEAPAELQRIVSKALRKDREERYQSSKDLQIDLRHLKQRLELDAEMQRSSQINDSEKTAGDNGQARMVGQQGTLMARISHLTSQVKRHNRSAALLLVILIIATAGAAFALFRLAGAGWGTGNSSKSAETGDALRSLAVLPFKQLGLGGSDDYLEVGMADALITRLSNLSQIIVRPTDAVLKYAAAGQDRAAAGRELGVDLLLNGQIQRSGDRIRVTVQLVNVKDGRPLWAEQLDEKSTDLFTVEDSISQRMAQALTLKLSSDEQQRLAKHSTENAEAYQEYLKGRYYLLQYTKDGFKNAVTHLNQAIALDPTYAMAYAGLADAYTTASNDLLAPREALPKARAAALKALSFDDNLAEAHAALGHAKFHGYDWSAEKDLQRALELNPNSVPVLLWYSEYWLLRDPIKAIPILQRAQQLDPLSLAVTWFLSGAYLSVRQPDPALKEALRMIEQDPNNPHSHGTLAEVYALQQNYPEAIAEKLKAKQLGAPPAALGSLGYLYAMSGKRDEARQVLAELSQAAKEQFVSPYAIAMVYVGLGEKDQAFAWLEKAYEVQDESLGFMRFDFWMDPLRSDPRYASLMKRLGLEP